MIDLDKMADAAMHRIAQFVARSAAQHKRQMLEKFRKAKQ